MSSKQWGRDLAMFSSFSFILAANFFQKKNWTTKQQKRGYCFFAEGFVHNVFTSGLSVKARCYRSQRKNDVPHSMFINFEFEETTILTIKEAHCTCDAGNSESCNHLVGLAYFLNDCVLRGNKEIPEDLSCTSHPMIWNRPRGPKIVSEPVADVIFHKPYNINRKKSPVMSTLFVPMRTNELKCIQDADVEKLKSSILSQHSNIPMGYLLTSNIEGSPQVNVLKDFNVSEDSVLGQHSFASSQPESQPATQIINKLDLDITLPLMDCEIFNILLLEPPVRHHTLEEVTFIEANKIEQNTRAQSKSNVWHKYRLLRFTASKFGFVCKRRAFNLNFIEAFTKTTDLSNIPSIQHGIQNEEPGKKKYLAEYKLIKYFDCGLVIHPFAQHLAATPDGIIYSDSDGYGVLEVKCPSSQKYSDLAGAVKVKTFCLTSTENGFMLKKKHDYYYQIQGQMLLLGVRWAHFVVFLTCSNEVHVEKINIDFKFCQEMYINLTNTYRNTILKCEL